MNTLVHGPCMGGKKACPTTPPRGQAAGLSPPPFFPFLGSALSTLPAIATAILGALGLLFQALQPGLLCVRQGARVLLGAKLLELCGTLLRSLLAALGALLGRQVLVGWLVSRALFGGGRSLVGRRVSRNEGRGGEQDDACNERRDEMLQQFHEDPLDRSMERDGVLDTQVTRTFTAAETGPAASGRHRDGERPGTPPSRSSWRSPDRR